LCVFDFLPAANCLDLIVLLYASAFFSISSVEYKFTLDSTQFHVFLIFVFFFFTRYLIDIKKSAFAPMANQTFEKDILKLFYD